MIVTLQTPIASALEYIGVVVDRIAPDPANQRWTCIVFGLVAGLADPVPLVLNTMHGPERIEALAIPYADISAACAAQQKAAGVIDDDVLEMAGMMVLTRIMQTPPPPPPEPVPVGEPTEPAQ